MVRLDSVFNSSSSPGAFQSVISILFVVGWHIWKAMNICSFLKVLTHFKRVEFAARALLTDLLMVPSRLKVARELLMQ